MAEQLLSIQNASRQPSGFALFNLGFRPFFLLGALFSFLAILWWGGIFVYGWSAPRLPFAPVYWHAHEMIFGYGMAVVAGFLLTAVRNWTNMPTLHGWPLAALALLWLAARLAGIVMPDHVLPMALLDGLFNVSLIAAIAWPVVRAKQKQQISVISKVTLLFLANGLFYLGVMGVLEQGIAWGLYSGVYLLVSLIFLMARRVLPFFIERGVGYPVQLKNRAWIDHASLYGFLLFWIADVFWRNVAVAAWLAALLFVIHAIRLMDWHTQGIWRKPLLWVLFAGYGCATFGFLLKALTPVLGLSPFLAIHAFAVGGIGIMTVGMMARVALGHTGRDIQQPSRLLTPVFIFLLAAFFARVLLPMMAPAHYLLWVGAAQAAWLSAFALFVWVYAPMLVQPRVDGLPG
ncbi:MAG: NnrS family protein [Burkholderiales bacterium]